MRRAKKLLSFFLLLTLSVAARASGDPCALTLPSPEALGMAFALGEGVAQQAEAAGAEVALVARVGLDLTKWGVEFTHLGWLWRPSPKDSWRIAHQLNVCGSTQARLYDTGPATFFMDSLTQYRARLAIPSPAMQAKLRQALASGLPEKMMGTRYNFLAHPQSPTDQSCTGWALELLAGALSPTPASSRTDAQSLLRERHYAPQIVQPNALTRLFVGLFYRRVMRLADQPDLFDYQVSSADSVMRWLLAQDPATRLVDVHPAETPP